jgi:hypothetical protein
MNEERISQLEIDMTKLEGDVLQQKMQHSLIIPQIESIQNVLRGDIDKGMNNPGILQTMMRMMRDLYGEVGETSNSILNRLRVIEEFNAKQKTIMGIVVFCATAAASLSTTLIMWFVEHKLLKP